MADPKGNEYLNSARARKDDKDLFAAIGKQVLGYTPVEGEDVPDDERVKIVDEIESLCMNCEQNVSQSLATTIVVHFITTTLGYDKTSVNEDPFLSRGYPHELLLRALQLQKHRSPTSWRDPRARLEIHLQGYSYR